METGDPAAVAAETGSPASQAQRRFHPHATYISSYRSTDGRTSTHPSFIPMQQRSSPEDRPQCGNPSPARFRWRGRYRYLHIDIDAESGAGRSRLLPERLHVWMVVDASPRRKEMYVCVYVCMWLHT